MKHSKVLNIVLAFSLLTAIVSLCGCKKKSTVHEAHVSSFSLKSSDKSPDLGSIGFAVDTLGMLIYNIDSVAYTSDLTRVLPVVGCYSTPSEIRVNDAVWNQTDLLDVTKPFRLSIVSNDKKIVNTYTVIVNKHTVDARTIGWTSLSTNLSESDYSDGKVFRIANKFFFVAIRKSDGKQLVYSSDDATTWELKSESDANVKIRSIYVPEALNSPEKMYGVGIDDAMYVMDTSDCIFKKDAFDIPSGFTLVDVVGDYDNSLLVLAMNGGEYKMLMYKYASGLDTESTSMPLPARFPIKGGYAKCNVFFDKSVISLMSHYLIGGMSASRLENTVYSCEYGISWANVVKDESHAPGAIKNGSAVWYDKRIIVFGGITNGDKTVDGYASYDTGFTWKPLGECERSPYTKFQYDIDVVTSADGSYVYMLGGKNTTDGYLFKGFRGRAAHMDFIIK